MTKALKWLIFTSVFLVGFYIYAERAVVNEGYMNFAGGLLLLAVFSGFRTLYLVVNGFFEHLESSRPQGATPRSISGYGYQSKRK